MYSLDGHAATLNIRPDSLCRSLVLGQSSGREGRTYSLTAQRRQPAKYLIRTRTAPQIASLYAKQSRASCLRKC